MTDTPFCRVEGPNQGPEIIRIEPDRKTLAADWPMICRIAEAVQGRTIGVAVNMGEAIAVLVHLVRRQAITECAILAARAANFDENAADAIFALLGDGPDRAVTEEELLAALKLDVG